jgi:hypothetical protein
MAKKTNGQYFYLFLSGLFLGCGSEPSLSSPADAGRRIDSVQRPDANAIKKPIDPKAPSIVGDWFYCKDKDCKRLSYFGMRFSKDGTVTNLYASTPTYSPHEPYCYLSHPHFVGEYVWTGKKMLADMPRTTTTITLPFVIENDRVNIAADGLPPKYLRHIPLPSAQGPCKDRIPWVCPIFHPDLRPILNGRIYSDSWTCDNGLFMLTCERHREDKEYTCSCLHKNSAGERLQETSRFQREWVGGPPTWRTFLELANRGCGWNIWIPFMFDEMAVK